MPVASAGDLASEHSEVTSVIRHSVKEGRQDEYESWLRQIVPTAAKFPGHRGVNVIRPPAGAREYTVVLHFDTIDNLRGWLDSAERRQLIGKVLPILAGEDSVEIKTGLEFWFTPPSGKQLARPYKQYLVTLSVIYPLSILVPALFALAFERIPVLLPQYIRQLFTDAALVGLITYVIMPRYVRLIAKWLYA
jgi:antibiotic biosynthesis monooxygenase (ABM) superfamily enzyme